MQNGFQVRTLTAEEMHIILHPSEELTIVRTENARLILAARCFERAVDEHFTEMEGRLIHYLGNAKEARRETRQFATKLLTLVERSHAFVTEVTALLQKEGLRLCESNPAEVQAAIDRFHDHLADYQ